MTVHPTLSRRAFLAASGSATLGLTIGLRLDATTASAATTAEAAAFNPFVRVAPDGVVTVLVKHLDKGQGIATGLATLVAEELDAPWEAMRVEFAPADAKVYNNLEWGEVQGTGGSSSISNAYTQYRTAGAAAREMLKAAAAKDWGVPAGEVTLKQGVLSHASGKTAPHGTFAAAAAAMPVPEKPPLKDASAFVHIGKGFRRLDTRAKSHGERLFTLDQKLPGMHVAVLARSPKFGGKVASVDDAAARAVPGVVDVVRLPEAVAVIAKSTWPALKGRDALKVDWDFSAAESRGSDALFTEYRALAATPGKVFASTGDAEAALGKAATVIEADFEFPYLAHAPMEPLDVIIRHDGQTAEVWTGSQLQTVDHAVAASILGLDASKVQIHTLWAGGSFGRRAIANAHYVAEAAMLAKAWGKPDPVKIVWSREDDIKGGYYRPMYVHRVKAGLDGEGNLVAWHHRIVGQSILTGTPFEAFMVKDGIDATSVEGVADMPYAIPNFQGELHTVKVGVPVLWWRSVGHTHTAYVVETMIDDLAKAAGRDPFEFRMKLLDGHPRHQGVLKLAAEKAGWGTPLAQGRHRGIAVHESFKSFAAQVAEVSVKPDGSMKVERVVCAIDCGLAVNPDIVAAQMEGGIGYGLGAAMRNAITLKDGEIEQANFDAYEPLRLSDMPLVETHIVASVEPPTGVGEPGVPPAAPAVANAWFAATGTRWRKLPFSSPQGS